VPKDEAAAEALFAKAEGLFPPGRTRRLAPYTAWLGARALQREDAVQARHWLMLGAHQVDLEAMTTLGLALHQGRVLPLDEAQAEYFLSMAADAGVVRAQRGMVELYRHFQPTPRPVLATMWAILVSERGTPLDWLVRWNLEATLTPQERSEAAELARASRARHARAK
jgi:TPR repeat protein